jgi:hypothetical protein
MGSLKASLWFNSIIALVGPPGVAKVVDIMTKDTETLMPFMKMIKDNDMIVICGIVFIISYLVAILGNISSSLNKKGCHRYNLKNAMSSSLMVPIFVTVGLLLGIMVPIFQDPWINLLSGQIEKNLALVKILPYVVGGFMALCLSWSGTASSHFSYIERACADNDDLISKRLTSNSSSDATDASTTSTKRDKSL